jgi:hypothetical protein
VRAALLGLRDVLTPALSSRAQADEYLDTDSRIPSGDGDLVPVAVDWQLVNGWRDVISRLRDDAIERAARGGIMTVPASACAGTRPVGGCRVTSNYRLRSAAYSFSARPAPL